MNRFYSLCFLLGLTQLFTCSRPLPKKIHKSFQLQWDITAERDSVVIEVGNPLACPVLFTIAAKDTEIKEALKPLVPQVLEAYENIRLRLPANWTVEKIKKTARFYAIQSRSNGVSPDSTYTYTLPFLRGRSYPIMQAYGGKFSHRQSAFAYYALDFSIPIGDTVCAARDGVVVGVVDQNEDWIHGPDRKYRDYANLIRLYHSDETYTDYVHLKHQGALVELGDTVQAGQPIGIAGYTGFTSKPHLHFNTIMPTDTGTLVGFPVQFETIDGRDLKKGMRVGHD